MSVRFYFRNADAPFDETATLLSGDLTPNIREVFCDRINHDDCKCSASTKNSITYADLGDHLPKSDKSVISVGSPRKITSSICFSSSFPVSTYMARYLL